MSIENNNQENLENQTTPTPDETEARLHDAITKRKGDADALAGLAQELIDVKRKANAEAKEYRERYEALIAEQEAQKRERELAEMTELQRLQEEIRLKDEALAETNRKLQEEVERQAELEFSYLLEKNGAKDSEYVEYLLEKHLSSIEDDEEKMDAFDLDYWLKDLRRERPEFFKGAEDKVVKNSGSLDNSRVETREDRQDKIPSISKTRGDKKKAEEDFKSFLAKLNRR